VSGEALKLTVYFGERDRTSTGLVADALLDLYGRHELQGSVLFRGARGFGLEHHLRTDRLLSLSEDLPVVSVAVDLPERILGLLEEVRAITPRGIVTVERARMLTVDVLTGESLEPPAIAELRDDEVKLTVHLGRHQRVAGKPAFVAICELLHAEGVAGATVLLGVDGTRHGQRKRARFFARNSDVPMLVMAVGTGARMAAVLPKLGERLVDPLFTLERVRVCKRDGLLLEPPPPLPDGDGHGLDLWQRVTVVSAEAALHDGRPLHLELIRRLRGAGAAGATSMRGIWGFHGDHDPHGDRLLSLRRRAPMLTTTVDTPERTRRLFAIIDELTAERGLVTCETVPAMTAAAHGQQRGGLQLARSASIVMPPRGCSSVG
jgi:PII-like signaling protein